MSKNVYGYLLKNHRYKIIPSFNSIYKKFAENRCQSNYTLQNEESWCNVEEQPTVDVIKESVTDVLHNSTPKLDIGEVPSIYDRILLFDKEKMTKNSMICPDHILRSNSLLQRNVLSQDVAKNIERKYSTKFGKISFKTRPKKFQNSSLFHYDVSKNKYIVKKRTNNVYEEAAIQYKKIMNMKNNLKKPYNTISWKPLPYGSRQQEDTKKFTDDGFNNEHTLTYILKNQLEPVENLKPNDQFRKHKQKIYYPPQQVELYKVRDRGPDMKEDTKIVTDMKQYILDEKHKQINRTKKVNKEKLNYRNPIVAATLQKYKSKPSASTNGTATKYKFDRFTTVRRQDSKTNIRFHHDRRKQGQNPQEPQEKSKFTGTNVVEEKGEGGTEERKLIDIIREKSSKNKIIPTKTKAAPAPEHDEHVSVQKPEATSKSNNIDLIAVPPPVKKFEFKIEKRHPIDDEIENNASEVKETEVESFAHTAQAPPKTSYKINIFNETQSPQKKASTRNEGSKSLNNIRKTQETNNETVYSYKVNTKSTQEIKIGDDSSKIRNKTNEVKQITRVPLRKKLETHNKTNVNVAPEKMQRKQCYQLDKLVDVKKIEEKNNKTIKKIDAKFSTDLYLNKPQANRAQIQSEVDNSRKIKKSTTDIYLNKTNKDVSEGNHEEIKSVSRNKAKTNLRGTNLKEESGVYTSHPMQTSRISGKEERMKSQSETKKEANSHTRDENAYRNNVKERKFEKKLKLYSKRESEHPSPNPQQEYQYSKPSNTKMTENGRLPKPVYHRTLNKFSNPHETEKTQKAEPKKMVKKILSISKFKPDDETEIKSGEYDGKKKT